jgi:hypothetical protein
VIKGFEILDFSDILVLQNDTFTYLKNGFATQIESYISVNTFSEKIYGMTYIIILEVVT